MKINSLFFKKTLTTNSLLLLVILFSIILPASLISQEDNKNWIIGATGSIGISKITPNFPLSENQKVKYNFSGKLGMFMENQIDQKSSIGIEALWIQIEGKLISKTRDFFIQNSRLEGIVSNKTRIHSSYIGVPIYYRLKFKKIGIKTGFQPMILLFSNTKEESHIEVDRTQYSKERQMKNMEFKFFDIGPKVGIDYKLNDQFRLRADYYHGLIQLTQGDYWPKKNRQFSLGVQYLFRNNR